MVSVNLRRPLTGLAAVAAMLGWLQLAPAFGFPVTAPAGMLDRVLGAGREAGPAGWVLLLLGLVTFVALYFLVVEQRAEGPIGPIVFALAAWLVSGAVVMPIVALLQGAPIAGPTPADPMRATLFMANLGVGAAGEALVGWLLFGAVLGAGVMLKVSPRAFSLAVGVAVLATAVALAVSALASQAGSGHVVEGRLAALPVNTLTGAAGPVFISVLELPQPAGAVLGPHKHVAGFVVDTFGTATMVIAGNVVDVGPGDAAFTADQLPHDHENRAAVPLAIVLALVVVGLTVAVVLSRGRRLAVALTAAVLVAGTVATVNPLMNHWYFIGVRSVGDRGAAMPFVPAAHRTFESENLTGLATGPFLERLTDRRLSSGESVNFVGPGAIVVLDGQVSVVADGRTAGLSAQSGTTIAGGSEAVVKSESGSARVLIVQVLPGN
jgi:hypothetical protein